VGHEAHVVAGGGQTGAERRERLDVSAGAEGHQRQVH
jgi:hypothetical protein